MNTEFRDRQRMNTQKLVDSIQKNGIHVYYVGEEYSLILDFSFLWKYLIFDDALTALIHGFIVPQKNKTVRYVVVAKPEYHENIKLHWDMYCLGKV